LNVFWLFGLALVLIFFGWRLTRQSREARLRAGIPVGRVIYADSQSWRRTAQPFFSDRYRLVGKPDYLVETGAGLIPVEVKSSSGPTIPYVGHLLQLAAYCLLVEEVTGQRPPQGLIQYQDKLFEVDFTLDLRRELFETLAAIRTDREQAQVSRSHDNPAKCGRCRFRGVCDESLVSS
jgi:CRISPR-associated exonuclease Cas4